MTGIDQATLAEFTALFLSDVASHRIEVKECNGLYRHLRFKRPGTQCMSFDILTWPGHLCFTGDMGTFVFSRLVDMLTFFRRDAHSRPYQMSLSYWASKVLGTDKSDGIAKFSPDKLQANVRRWLDDYAQEKNMGCGERDMLRADADEVVRASLDAGEHAVHAALRDFTHHGRSVFQDFWEIDCSEYTPRFLWCCHALEWAIEVYDATQAAQELTLQKSA